MKYIFKDYGRISGVKYCVLLIIVFYGTVSCGYLNKSSTIVSETISTDTNYLRLASEIVINSPCAGSLMSKGDTLAYEKAIEYLVRGKNKNPKDTLIRSRMIQYLLRIDRDSSAMVESKEMIQYFPTLYSALSSYGLILEKNGRRKESIQFYQKALDLLKNKETSSFERDLNIIFLENLIDDSFDPQNSLEKLRKDYSDKNIDFWIRYYKIFNRKKFINSFHK